MNRTHMPLVIKILMCLSIALMALNAIHHQMQPSDEEVQQRMQEGLKNMQLQEEIRESEAKWKKINDDLKRNVNQDSPKQP